MARTEASKQFSLRLPVSLVDKLKRCRKEFSAMGLEMTRTDVVRLLLNHSLEATKCNLHLLLPQAAPARTRRNG
jgi:hypothetical protein